MTPSETSSAASRLCAACGMCCNGVMFHTVRMQPADSAKDLAALGLKLKRKKGHRYLLQPCPAFRETHCSIYTARPERCRLFECRQLQRVASGEITEETARAKIAEARGLVAELDVLLKAAGATNLRRPLSKRCEKATAEPLHAASDPAAVDARHRLTRTKAALDALLNRDFRIVPLDPPEES